MASGSVSITIKLFSALREVLGESEFELDLTDSSVAGAQVDVAAIKSLLSERGAAWKEALNQPNPYMRSITRWCSPTRWSPTATSSPSSRR